MEQQVLLLVSVPLNLQGAGMKRVLMKDINITLKMMVQNNLLPRGNSQVVPVQLCWRGLTEFQAARGPVL
ncbi:hypothetical protein [Endozoicomonas sp. GU-1]|uniref:hypothetical protein n=1 Tax=Endozoicomonas sp. GU-1 TaxID=3009078 RepID=UPI0022B5D401|nr:hypothetical protein [Endozoicomonas sp. GU-1]WBA88685.1 hypothetical protein O3276_12125 [Endozoicomonas sp. GU-1]